ncbi:AraC family transcriptional regulator [Eisenibacter elegans]|uniref:AraC family transcriptional regulator n=1 Tax=Eisenibacter elegans TaxID=997 RepID=UPI0004219DCE|nr:AraC family transcriptional regulator [Eisenibacter elegans]
MQHTTNIPTSLYHPKQKIDRLVENKTTFHTARIELNLFETFEVAEAVALRFDSPVFVAMISGKKVMHFDEGRRSFPFLPHQSFVLPAGKSMTIDFPEASIEQPTRCLALAISDEMIQDALQKMERYFPKASQEDWQVAQDHFSLIHCAEISATIERLIEVLRQPQANGTGRAFADLITEELIIRLMQTESKHFLLQNHQQLSDGHRLARLITYIRDNLHQALTIDSLCEAAHLSKPSLFRHFKNEMGLTPVEFIQQERIRLAQKLLRQPLMTVTDACYEAGFNSLNYFIKVFKKMTGKTPKEYQQSCY